MVYGLGLMVDELLMTKEKGREIAVVVVGT